MREANVESPGVDIGDGEDEHNAARLIQSRHRGRQARAEVQRMREASVESPAVDVGEGEDEHNAARLIQSRHRGRQARAEVANQQRAAVAIQAAVRGQTARARVTQQKVAMGLVAVVRSAAPRLGVGGNVRNALKAAARHSKRVAAVQCL